MAKRSESGLVLGFRATSKHDPRGWSTPTAKAGDQTDEDLFRVPAETMGTHTVIIAQSGAGKSFFLGRIVEELMLRTKARCLVLDPNADFRRIKEVEPETLWTEARYDSRERQGKLPHESSRKEFATRWSKVAIRVRGRAKGGSDYEPLEFWWPFLSMDFLADEINPMKRSDLYHCHSFVKSLGTLLSYKLLAKSESTDIIETAQDLFRFVRMDRNDLQNKLNRDYNITEILGDSAVGKGEWITLANKWNVPRAVIQHEIDSFVAGALTISKYVTQDIETFYFGTALQYRALGILQQNTPADLWSTRPSYRLDVIDLPSLDKSARLLAINALLNTEWEHARRSWNQALKEAPDKDDRVPTIIVIDEAHNLIPKKARNKAEASLREQFRTIAAEGRKYGLFLLLVSQRPDKLDSLVVSECENKALMRVGSASVLETTRRMLGLDDLPERMLEKCLEFDIGRVLLTGRWAPDGPQIMYSAARRTMEGGRNLRASHWATPAVGMTHVGRRPRKAVSKKKR